MTDVVVDDAILCANRECRVAQTGNCVEGYELDKCPHYGRALDTADAPDDHAETDAAAGLRLPGADTLNIDAAARILRGRTTRVIAIIGPKGPARRA